MTFSRSSGSATRKDWILRNSPDKFKKLNGIFKKWDTEGIAQLLNQRKDIGPDALALAKAYHVTAYGFFCYSVKVWDQYNDELLKLRKGQRILRGGRQLAADHMPQGDMLLIPLTSNIGYQSQCHVVVHLQNADPDLGRKGFQPELKELAEDVSVSIVSQLRRWRGNLKHDTGAAPQLSARGIFTIGSTNRSSTRRRRPSASPTRTSSHRSMRYRLLRRRFQSRTSSSCLTSWSRAA